MKIALMHPRVVPLLIAIMIFWSYDEVEGLSNKEDEELERQLKLLNKPAVKTIKTEHGDIYDCVNFYQQPAFDHPLLKNHTYHPQTSFSLTKRDMESSTFRMSSKFGLGDGGCPTGTVPIRRTMKEDLIRERNYVNRFNASYAGGVFHFALAQTRESIISGAGATVSIYNPKVQFNQWSASTIRVQNGRDQIQAGWRVDPILYGDIRTRFFVSFKAGTTQCYNTRCPGFVLVDKNFLLDHVFGGVSHPGLIAEDAFYIHKNLKTRAWWLHYGRDPAIQVGYWPPEIFTALKGYATQASWGGEAFSSTSSSPPMGSGIFPKLDTDKDAYLSKVFIHDSVGKKVDAGELSSFEDAPALYKVTSRRTGTKAFEHLVLFGGPGN